MDSRISSFFLVVLFAGIKGLTQHPWLFCLPPRNWHFFSFPIEQEIPFKPRTVTQPNLSFTSRCFFALWLHINVPLTDGLSSFPLILIQQVIDDDFFGLSKTARRVLKNLESPPLSAATFPSFLTLSSRGHWTSHDRRVIMVFQKQFVK